VTSALLAALALLALLLTCGCADAPPPAVTQHAARSTQHAGGAGTPIVLDFWNGFTGPDGKTMERLVRQFEAANPDVRVRMQIIPWGTYYDKLTLSLAFGGAPELFVLHAARLPEYASYEVLRPLEDLGRADPRPLTAADFAPVPWRASFYGGRQFGLPLDVHPFGLYYNPRLFREAGIVDAAGHARPPANWEEFLTAARRLTRDTDGDGRPDQWGFVFTWQRSNWYTLAAQFGGGILSDDFQECVMTAPASLEAVRRMRDLVYTYRVAPVPEDIDAWLAFRQGKVGMALNGIYMLASLEEQRGLEYAAAPTPQFGPRPGTWGDSHLLCQPAANSAEAAGAAWRLTRYLSDHSLTWAEGGQVPTRVDVLQSPEFAALPVPSQFARQLPYVYYLPATPKLNALLQFVDPAIEACLLNLQRPEAAMADASRRIEQVLRRP
jgi:multiple sugar transport system substrate-binding protein